MFNLGQSITQSNGDIENLETWILEKIITFVTASPDGLLTLFNLSLANKMFATLTESHYPRLVEVCKSQPSEVLQYINGLKGNIQAQRQFLKFYREKVHPKFSSDHTFENTFNDLSFEERVLFILSTDDINTLKQFDWTEIKTRLETEEIKKLMDSELIKNIICPLMANNDRMLALPDVAYDEEFILNLRGVFFSDKDLTGCTLSGTDFHSAYLHGVVFNSACIKNTIFYDASLREAQFKSAQLLNVDFTHADLTNTNFMDSKLENCHLRLTRGIFFLFSTAPKDQLNELRFFLNSDFCSAESLQEILDAYNFFSEDIFNNISNAQKLNIKSHIAKSLIKQVNSILDSDSEKKITLFKTAEMHDFFNSNNFNTHSFFEQAQEVTPKIIFTKEITSLTNSLLLQNHPNSNNPTSHRARPSSGGS